jgi:hypothetical protein
MEQFVKFFLVVVVLCHVSGIYLFSKGFFLTRYSVDKVSECDISTIPSLSSSERDMLVSRLEEHNSKRPFPLFDFTVLKSLDSIY